MEVQNNAIEDIMWADDEDFERAVKDLNLRSILELMEALQTVMRKEQLHFEQLTLQLQQHPDQHRKISSALCSTQCLLTKLCTKHMMCSSQRSLRSSFAENSLFVDNSLNQVDGMSFSTVENRNRGCDFKKSLRFFQSQVEGSSISSEKDISVRSKSSSTREQSDHDVVYSNKANLNPPNSVSSVESILNSVKSLCAIRHEKVILDAGLSSSPIHTNLSNDQMQSLVPGAFQTQCSAAVIHSEQVSVYDRKILAEHNQLSLLSSFNPSFEVEELGNDIGYQSMKSLTSYRSRELESFSLINSRDDSLINDFEQEVTFDKVNLTSCPKTIPYWNYKPNSICNVTNYSRTLEHVIKGTIGDLDNANPPTSGQCKAQIELNKHPQSQDPAKLSQSRGTQKEISKSFDFTPSEILRKGDAESISEKISDSFESDYNSQDFIVHKTSFPEDYLEAMSEDYSSVNEDYEVEHARSSDIPSPDYVSDEEYPMQKDEEACCNSADNTTQYMKDPRRYLYYDDKELEVIPEEDEDGVVEYEENHEDSCKPDVFFNPSNNPRECDSGLIDDQRSGGSSTALECELEDDTDSAKGSLSRQDSNSDSPTQNEPANIFPNHKSAKKGISPIKQIVEDYENDKSVSILHQNDDIRPIRNTTSSWDPHELLNVLYCMDFPAKPLKKPIRYINKEGSIEKLPSGRRKATYWNPWKTKYIQLQDGFLYCYDNSRSEKPSMTLQLMGGHIDSLDNRMIGVDDKKGHYVVLRCSNEDETETWENALRSQCAEDFINAYTNPCLYPLKISKNIIIIDLGSCSVRAGILMSSPSLPQLFFPAVCATDKLSQKKLFGVEALKPSMRKDSLLSFPLHPSSKVTKNTIDVSILPDLMKHIFRELNVQPENFKVQLSMPRNLSLQTKLKIASMLLDDFQVNGINLTHQAILSLHAYNSKSGIIVDIGDRLDVIPIIEGYIVESGVTRLPYGGQRMVHHLKHALAEKNISLVTDVETYLARYILEQLCYIAEDYNEELYRYHINPDDFEMSISISHFFKKDKIWDEIVLDLGRFNVPEGLFTPEKWGMDNPGLHKLVHHAIQECGVDLRREMCQSIYVSGGLSLLPGFVERLENEVDKLIPNTLSSKVHASPYRYHMSYIGACQIALGDTFNDICLTKQIWKKEGNTCVKKWHI